MTDPNLVAKLQAENARLIALLDAHGIEWRLPNELVKLPADPAGRSQQLDTDGKLALFRGLFRGRTDVYPIRWEARQANQDTRPLAQTNGGLAFVRSPELNVATAVTANCFP